MSRDITKLHPRLQAKIDCLIYSCKIAGLTIGISECYRTVKEQDELYAQGRTKPGKIVTKAKGGYSMHNWGVAFDFYRRDGKGAFNDKDGFFEKVGKIGQSIGLEWGGSWTSINDAPHFQLPYWGSGTVKLKKKHGTPEKFRRTWKDVKGDYTTKKDVIMRRYCGKDYHKLTEIPKGTKLVATGLYDKSKSGFTWYQVEYIKGKTKTIGYIPKSSLKRVK